MKKLFTIITLIFITLLSGCFLSTNPTISKNNQSKPISNKPKSTIKTNNSAKDIKTEVIDVDVIDKDIDGTVERVNIVSINDTHGQLMKTDNGNMGMAEVGGLIDYLEDEDGLPFIKICDGDLFQGSYVSKQSNGKCFIDALNALNFDIFVPGNHEFDWGLETISIYWDGDVSNGEANFPFVCCNLIDSKTGLRPDYCDPYAIIKYGDLKVGVIGAIGDTLESSVSISSIGTYYFDNLDGYIGKYTDELKNEKNCDIIILSVHDYDDYDKYSKYVETLEYPINAFIFGHTHQSLDGYYRNPSTNEYVPYIECYTKNLNIGTITLEVENKKVVDSTTNHYNKGYFDYYVKTPNKACEDALIVYKELIELGDSALCSINLYDYDSQSEVADLAIRAMMDRVGADVGFVNTGGVRVKKFTNENLTYADINEAFPFDNKLCYSYMTGYNLKEYLYHNSNIFLNLSFNERNILDTKIYKVCTIDYVVTNYGYFIEFSEDNKVYYTEDILRDVIADYLRK